MSSNRTLGLLVLVGCNQVFGNHSVGQAPNEIFDAPIDAPFRCPEIGASPAFSPLLHQYEVLDCEYYAEVAGEAIAVCNSTIEIGPIGGELQPAIGITNFPGESPRLAPDGSYMLVGGNLNGGVDLYRNNGTWTYVGATGIQTSFLGNIVDVNGVDRMLEADLIYNNSVRELVFDGELTWNLVTTHTTTELGTSPQSLWLTSDGLRLIVDEFDDQGGSIYYTDRATVGDPFRKADRLEIPSTSASTSLSDDCARIYLTGLGSVFYAQQR